MTGRAPRVLLALAALLALVLTWHTLGQDFGISPPVAGLLATAQVLPIAAALRWPRVAWSCSTAVLIGAALVVRAAGVDDLWPDPNLYVHLGVMLIAGSRSSFGELGVMWAALVGAGIVTVTVGDVSGSPGLLETIGLASIVVVVAGVVSNATRTRERALTELAAQQRTAEAQRIGTALLQERARIARELHDVVAHHMSVIAMQAEAAPLRADVLPAVTTEALVSIRASALDGLAELRHVVGLLRDAGSDTTAPQPELRDLDGLLDDLRAAGVQVEIEAHGKPGRYSPGVQLSAYRIVQESLSNAMRHAPGSSITVELRHAPDRLGIAIRNACPTSTGEDAGAGHGLLGMQERASMLGGTLDVGPTDDGGYLVTAWLPTGNRGEA